MEKLGMWKSVKTFRRNFIFVETLFEMYSCTHKNYFVHSFKLQLNVLAISCQTSIKYKT